MSWLIISRLSCGNSITSSRSWIQLLFITSLKSIFVFYLFCCLWSNGDFKGVGRPSKDGVKTLASRFQCCKECYQFAPCLAFSILAFKGIRISIPQLWIAKISRRPKNSQRFDLMVGFVLESSSRFSAEQTEKQDKLFLALFALQFFVGCFSKSQQNWLKKPIWRR